MQQTKVLETWVGLFVALGMVSLFFLAMKVSNLGALQTQENSFRVTARFQNVGSLRERAPVSMAGVRVGRVSAIRFDKETYEAVVEMRIDPQYDTIPDDSSAGILTAGLLGEQYIGLSAGGSPDFLKEGGKIELTQSALVLEEVISRFLFSKAEGGADKKTAASSGSGDMAEDAAIHETSVAKPAQSAQSGETAAAVRTSAPESGAAAKPAPKPKASVANGASDKAEKQAKPKAAAQ